MNVRIHGGTEDAWKLTITRSYIAGRARILKIWARCFEQVPMLSQRVGTSYSTVALASPSHMRAAADGVLWRMGSNHGSCFPR